MIPIYKPYFIKSNLNMRHSHISLLCNELLFLKRKLPFLYKHFDQIIFVDYDLMNEKNSTDGSIEYIENFEDSENKITLLKFSKHTKIEKFKGSGFEEKRKMFAYASEVVRDDIDIVWATDMDEFFNESLISVVESIYKSDGNLQSIDLPHKVFIFNEHNYFPVDDFYITPRITKHKPKFLYGHCDFGNYGKTIKYTDEFLYHYAFVGYKRTLHKQKLYDKEDKDWFERYLKFLNNGDQYVDLEHPSRHRRLRSDKYLGSHPEYLDVDNMCNELNEI